MKKTLFLAIVVSFALVFGCNKKSEENLAEKQVKNPPAKEETVSISDNSASVKAGEEASKIGSVQETIKEKKQQKPRQGKAKPIIVNNSNFESEVLKSEIPVMVDFWAPWCRPCRIAAPTLEKMAQQYQGRLKVCKLNVDDARQTAMKYGIKSIPTLNIYKNGEVIDQIIGITRTYESDLKKKIESYL